jgi:hypothetical protein
LALLLTSVMVLPVARVAHSQLEVDPAWYDPWAASDPSFAGQETAGT